MAPDALHLYSPVFRRVAMPIERPMKEMNRNRANARVAPRLWLHSALGFALAILFHDNTPLIGSESPATLRSTFIGIGRSFDYGGDVSSVERRRNGIDRSAAS